MKIEDNEERKKAPGGHDILKLVAICAAVMLAVPFGLRFLAERFLPAERESSLTATEKLQDLLEMTTVERTAEELLKKPLVEWTERERAAQPVLAAWLAEHEKKVLPWEWSTAAQTKDAEAYGKAWRTLHAELNDLCKTDLARVSKQVKSQEDEVATQKKLLMRLTNQIERLESSAVTNVFPLTVSDERVEPGWLWGFNVKANKIKVATEAELRDVLTAQRKKEVVVQSRIAELVLAVAESGRMVKARQLILTELDASRECLATNLALVVKTIRTCRRKAESKDGTGGEPK